MVRHTLIAFSCIAVLAACREGSRRPIGSGPEPTPTPAETPAPLGPTFTPSGDLQVVVFSARATRLELWLYDEPVDAPPLSRHAMTNDGAGRWSVTLPADGLPDTVFYGLRAWGPNWTFDPSWTPGSETGFAADVDGAGNRFNPNKLLLDPYAPEISHDPLTETFTDGSVYASGPNHRRKDSGPSAPKAIALRATPVDIGVKPTRAFRDDIVYEVHVRGLTRNDPSVPEEERGTYAGAALKAGYLKDLGITAIELLPVQETQNDQNDRIASADGDNYWGYSTLAYFAPDRRYASDRSPGGPTRELQAMVKAFHDEGIKVFIDVVYNHTGEGGLWDGSGDTTKLLSFRGLDNATWYELDDSGRYYVDNTGIGANLNAANPVARDFILDSLRYWKDTIGVDGFRFDLAPVLGNRCETACFDYDASDPANALNRAAAELPARPAGGGEGVELIAEPWAIGNGTYQIGNFPDGWAEWNGIFRDSLRSDQNQLGIATVTPDELVTRIGGSPDLYRDDGRKPWHSVNYVVSHDGFTLRDLYSYDAKNNGQPWPFGPSDGGSNDNRSWGHGGNASLQRQAARNGLALVLLSAGVPMITGGDEMYRTQYGNNNPYNLDSDKNWLDWSDAVTNARFLDFARRMLRFRNAHPVLRPAEFFRGLDGNGDGRKDVTWLKDDGGEANAAYLNDPTRHFLAFRLDGTEAGDDARSIYVAYNGWSGTVTATLPPVAPGLSWYRVADTAAWMEPMGNAEEPGSEDPIGGPTYDLAGRSVLVLLER